MLSTQTNRAAPRAPMFRPRWLAHARACAQGARPASSAATSDAASGQALVSLERSVGERMGSDAALWRTGAFGAAVYPDLPIATTWEGLFKAFGK